MDNKDDYSSNWDESAAWTKGMISALAEKETEYAVTVIQFSGEKKLEVTYIPGSLGASNVQGIDHFRIEVEPTLLRENNNDNIGTIHQKIDDMDTLDGNSQLFLCLQDLTMDQFRNKLISKNDASIIVVTDDEWDIANLKTPSGSAATRDGVVAELKSLYSVQMVCVHMHGPGHDLSAGQNFINDVMCADEHDSAHYVHTENYESGMCAARDAILSKL